MKGIATRAAAALVLSLFAGLWAAATHAQGGPAPKSFFKPVAAAKAGTRAKVGALQGTHTEAAPVRFNAAEMLDLRYLEEVQLALPNGRTYTVVFELATRHDKGVATWVGHFKERGTHNRVVVSTGPGGSFGELETPHGSFRIVPGGAHDWLVDMTAEERFLPPMKGENDAVIPPGARKSRPDLAQAASHDGIPGVNMAGLPKATPVPQNTVDIMFVVTKGLADRLGDTLPTRLAQLVARANTAYTDSEVAITLRQVNYIVADFPDNANDTAALDSITPGCTVPSCTAAFNPAFASVVPMRDQYGADVVAFLRDGPAFTGSGLAYVSTDPASMYSTVNGCVLGCEFVFIHEVGHNMGNMHDRATTAWQDADKGVLPQGRFPYSYGYAFCLSGTLTCDPALVPGSPGACAANQQPECAQGSNQNLFSNFSDIMAFFHASTQRLYKFSNPLLNCASPVGDGVPRPCGIADPAANSADTALSMNNHRAAMSAMRATALPANMPGQLRFKTRNATAFETAGSMRFTVERINGAGGAVSVSWMVGGQSALPDFDFPGVNGTLTWADGDTADKTLTVPLVDDLAAEGVENFTVALFAPAGAPGVALGYPSVATGTILEAWPPGGTLPAGFANAAGSSAAWAPSTDFAADGDVVSLKSGAIPFQCPGTCDPVPPVPAPSVLETTGTFANGVVSFAYRVDSYPNNGFFEFLVDGTVVLSESGLTGTKLFSVSLAAGNHTLQWRYRPTLYFPCSMAQPPRDPANPTACADRAWIDSVSLPLPVAASAVALASSANPSVTHQAITLTATVMGGAGNASGTVTFKENGAPIAGCVNVTLAGNTAACTSSTFPIGVHPITATYSGNATYRPSQSTVLQQTVNGDVTLTVAKPGGGNGTVSSNPAAIDCGGTCAANVASGSPITLTATAAPGSLFAGWSGGGCTGLGACTVTMAASTTVTAMFQPTAQPPGVGVEPGVLDFDRQSMHTTTPAQSIAVTNSSGGTLTVSGVATSDPQFAQTHDCATLAPGATCTVNVTFTPAATGTTFADVTVGTSNGTARVFVTGLGEQSLVTHYYRSILRRAPDAGGKAFWEGERARVVGLGANVNETWFSMAQSFYGSAEYLAFNRDDTGFVTDLYNTFFNRPPDADGLSFWVGQIQAGMPREVALVSFMFSQEFANFTQAIFGNTAVRAEIDTVLDFYRGLLARLPDDGGFTFWRGQFRAAQCQGAAAVTAQAESISSAFALSAEYAQRARSHAQYVGDLYNAFLRRGGDLGGVQFWINEIATGARTRENVRQQFVASPEFQGRANAVIAAGCVQ